MRHPALLAPSLALALALLAGGPALSALRVGTDGPDTLTGTHKADRIEGKGGDDVLKGLAGNDVYAFADGWGADALVEKARHRVGGKRLPGGSDTLDFSAMSGGVEVALVPEWVSVIPAADGPANGAKAKDQTTPATLELNKSRVENVVGGQAGDSFSGGQARNTFRGGGGDDFLGDGGGWDDGPGGRPELAASDDAYAGFGADTGRDLIGDFGGKADVLDLRPLRSTQAVVHAVDLDENGTTESLLIVTGDASSVFVIGHFAPYSKAAPAGMRGRIEKVVFKDRTISGDKMRELVASPVEVAAAGDGGGLAQSAEHQAAEARQRLEEDPPLLVALASGRGR